MTIEFCSDLGALRGRVAGWRHEGKRIGLVPTMGALHAGHLRLVEVAREAADRVIVTIFVNPKQFAPNEDFAAYPRDLGADCDKVGNAGADLVYAPSMDTVYPAGFATTVLVEGPATVGLEDKFRPTHFAGVATVVVKLLTRVQPDSAFFGEKDFQQLRVIQRLVLDLDLPVDIVPVPVVRETDGLALSSRNAYLSADERARAPKLHAALQAAACAIEKGARIDVVEEAARAAIAEAGFVTDYLEARRLDDLTPLPPDGEEGRLLVAARLGKTRLIDNVHIDKRRDLPNIAVG